MRSIKREKRKNIEKGKNRFWIHFVIFLPSSEERNKKSSKKSKKSKEIMSEVNNRDVKLKVTILSGKLTLMVSRLKWGASSRWLSSLDCSR